MTLRLCCASRAYATSRLCKKHWQIYFAPNGKQTVCIICFCRSRLRPHLFCPHSVNIINQSYKLGRPLLQFAKKAHKMSIHGAGFYARQNTQRGQIVGEYQGRLFREGKGYPYADGVVSLRELDNEGHKDNIKPQKMRSQFICPTNERHGFYHYINGAKNYGQANNRAVFGRQRASILGIVYTARVTGAVIVPLRACKSVEGKVTILVEVVDLTKYCFLLTCILNAWNVDYPFFLMGHGKIDPIPILVENFKNSERERMKSRRHDVSNNKVYLVNERVRKRTEPAKHQTSEHFKEFENQIRLKLHRTKSKDEDYLEKERIRKQRVSRSNKLRSKQFKETEKSV
ncbi:hypothetical protein ROZALSC1DRAFT_23261 [Rozella allomycis CSF55]|uniref:Uncharacterized protein n=1 Tax=Rozella allomycis (strain CSF55) TaxID=988480 RepID=A0A4P9YG15_ROZAC|nr:hypothetical protein ROZALSC1DRAFT_23261 [Rozella allomycis CSF55]